MFETSLQARMVIPMAVALGFAVLYATLVTLVLVPCLYMILEDLKGGIVSGYYGSIRLIRKSTKKSPVGTITQAKV